MILKPTETNTQKDLHGFEYTMSKKSTEMIYFGISEMVSVKIPPLKPTKTKKQQKNTLALHLDLAISNFT